MLKIKDNVDFKELGKYGFKKIKIKYDEQEEYIKDNLYTNEIIAIREDRRIYLEYTGSGFFGNIIEENAIDDLFRLIKDDLVEFKQID